MTETCYVCWEPTKERLNCKCKGTIGWIHHSCAKNMTVTCCPVCRQNITIQNWEIDKKIREVLLMFTYLLIFFCSHIYWRIKEDPDVLAKGFTSSIVIFRIVFEIYKLYYPI